MKPYQLPPRCVAYVLLEPFKKELERLQEHQILSPLNVDEMAEWYTRFVTVSKPSGTVQLCLNPVSCSQVLIRPIHRGQTLNCILLKQTNACKMTIIDAGSSYHRLNIDKNSLYLATFACHFGRYGFTRPPFGVPSVGNMIK